MESFKTCVVCGKKQSLSEFAWIGDARKIVNVCRDCQEESESGGGGGFQVDSVDQKYASILEDELKEEQKEEARDALDTRFFINKDTHQTNEAKQNKHTSQKETSGLINQRINDKSSIFNARSYDSQMNVKVAGNLQKANRTETSNLFKSKQEQKSEEAADKRAENFVRTTWGLGKKR